MEVMAGCGHIVGFTDTVQVVDSLCGIVRNLFHIKIKGLFDIRMAVSLKLLRPLIIKSHRESRSTSIMASSTCPIPDRWIPVFDVFDALRILIDRIRPGNAASNVSITPDVSVAMYKNELLRFRASAVSRYLCKGLWPLTTILSVPR